MRTLRYFSLLSRLVLAWFVLSLGVAVASPIVKPQDLLLVCSGSGVMKVLLKKTDGSTRETLASSMDCPLCATPGAPPPMAHAAAVSAQPMAYALQATPAASVAARTAAPLPARGPPRPA